MPTCELCGREFSPQGLVGHKRWVHGVAKSSKPIERADESKEILNRLEDLERRVRKLEPVKPLSSCPFYGSPTTEERALELAKVRALAKSALILANALDRSLNMFGQSLNALHVAVNVVKAWKSAVNPSSQS